ncbi:MAG TPA: hypothetical protein VK426_11385 [Methanobacterium sp.]|nr:hypothetical protein [Methanobacterium sp.]
MRKDKILSIGGLLIFILVLGSYYAYGIVAEDNYYENYGIAQFYGDKEDQLLNDTDNNWNNANGNMTKIKNIANSSLNNLKTSNEYDLKYQHYVKEMINYADSDLKKQYAELMLLQSNYSIEYNKMYIEECNLVLNTNWNDKTQSASALAKIDELEKKCDDLDSKISAISTKRDEIKSKYPEFSKRLDQEYEKSKNTYYK